MREKKVKLETQMHKRKNANLGNDQEYRNSPRLEEYGLEGQCGRGDIITGKVVE